MIFATNEARTSAIDSIDKLIIDVANSDGIVEELGYEEVSTIIKYLHYFQREVIAERNNAKV